MSTPRKRQVQQVSRSRRVTSVRKSEEQLLFMLALAFQASVLETNKVIRETAFTKFSESLDKWRQGMLVYEKMSDPGWEDEDDAS